MQEPRTHAQRAVSSPGEEPVASYLLPAAWNGPTWPTTYSGERTNWGPEARADCRLIKMVIVFSGGAQGVREKRGERGGGALADCSGYLCVAFVRIINVNLS